MRSPTNPAADLADLKQRLQAIADLNGAARRAALGPGDLHAARRSGGAGPPARLAERPRARADDRSGHRTPPRQARAVGRGAGGRLRRGGAHPRDAARLRPCDTGAEPLRPAAERALGDVVPRVGTRTARQRLRDDAPAARDHGRALPRARRLLPGLRPPVRRADRPCGGWNDGRGGAHALHRAARRAAAADRGDPRPSRARRRLPHRRLPGGDPARVRRKGHPGIRVRLHARPPGQDRAPVHDEARPRRRAHHHAVSRRRPVRRDLLDAARGRSRDVRAGRRRCARRHAALRRHDVGRAREPVAAVGKPGRPQPPVLAPLVRLAAVGVSGRALRRRRRHLLPGDQQGRPVARSGPTPTRSRTTCT